MTFGSRVPEWPVLSTRRMRFSQATTSWDEGLEGLSRLITPDLRYHQFIYSIVSHNAYLIYVWRSRLRGLTPYKDDQLDYLGSGSGGRTVGMGVKCADRTSSLS